MSATATRDDRPLEIASRLDALHLRRPQALAQAIEDEVASRELAPGTRLGTKADMRSQFGVASTTVNEAIRVLENRGVVHVKPGPGGGVFVAERSSWLALSQLVLGLRHAPAALAEVLAVRDALEALVDHDVAEHHRPGDLRDAHEALERMAAHVDDPAGYLRANWELHRRLARLCTNGFARSLYEGLLDLAESEVAAVEGRSAFSLTENLATHRRLLDAIASRDAERVAAAVRAHNEAARVVRP